MPRDPQFDPPTRSEALRALERLRKQYGIQDDTPEPEEKQPPAALPEHWPGGPNYRTDYEDDFRLAGRSGRTRRRRRSDEGYA